MPPLQTSPENKCTDNLTYNSSVYTIAFMEFPGPKNTKAINSQEVLLLCPNLMRIFDQIKAILPSALKD